MAKTRGNVIIEDIKLGDIHYEFSMNMCIKCEVITLPIKDEDNFWTWTSKNVLTGQLIEYSMDEAHRHYAPNLYDYEAYTGMKMV